MKPLAQLAADAAFDPYGDHTVTVAHRSGMLVLVSLLLSFLFIRTSARMIRAQVSWWPGNIETSSGLHIHHLVWGICLVLVSGFLGFALDPASPWKELLAVVFGIGAGLTLDEFSLWLHLEDVYWSEQGRSSVDAVIVAVTFAGLIVVGLSPLDLEAGGWTAVATSTGISFAIAAVAVLKGKIYLGVIGIFIPLVGIVAAIRLAKPTSPWARWRYKEGSKKLERANKRFEAERRRLEKFQDVVAGTPSDERKPATSDAER